MKKTKIALIVILLLLVGFLGYKSGFIKKLLNKTDKETTVENNIKQEEFIDTAAVTSFEAPPSEPEEMPSWMTDKQKITVEIEKLFEDGYFFKGEDFNETRSNLPTPVLTSVAKGITGYFLSKLISDLKQNPEKIEETFEDYKNVLYGLISNRSYRKSNMDKIFLALMMSYKDLNSGQDSKEKLEKIYNMMNYQDNYKTAEKLYSKIEPYTDKEWIISIEHLNQSSGKQFSDGDIVWFYSFWARRNHEGNIDSVYNVLYEIDKHYNPEDYDDSESSISN